MVTSVDKNEDQSNEHKQKLFIQSLLYSKGVSHSHLYLVDPKAGGEVGELYSGEGCGVGG